MKQNVIYLALFLITSPVFSQLYTVDLESSSISNYLDSVLVINLISTDSLWVKFGSNGTGLENEISGLQGPTIYPNPSYGEICVGLNNLVDQPATLSFYDLNGRIVYAEAVTTAESDKLVISNVPEGMYVLTIASTENQFSNLIISQSQAKNWSGVTTGHATGTKTTMAYIAAKSSLKSSTVTATTIALGDSTMTYNAGERLLLTGYSGSMKTVVSFIPTNDTSISFNFYACTDGDNNNYKVVEIDTMVWMAENLKTTSYNNGIAIPNVTGTSEWAVLTTPAYCWYNNDSATNSGTYGALYNWYVVETGNLCPSGWHVPTDEEWKQLEMAIGMSQSEADYSSWQRGTNEGTKLKATSGWFNNGNGTDDYGFKALPGGSRFGNGSFSAVDRYADFWSSTAYDSYSAWYRELYYSSKYVDRSKYTKDSGYSLRCVRDSE